MWMMFAGTSGEHQKKLTEWLVAAYLKAPASLLHGRIVRRISLLLIWTTAARQLGYREMECLLFKLAVTSRFKEPRLPTYAHVKARDTFQET